MGLQRCATQANTAFFQALQVSFLANTVLPCTIFPLGGSLTVMEPFQRCGWMTHRMSGPLMIVSMPDSQTFAPLSVLYLSIRAPFSPIKKPPIVRGIRNRAKTDSCRRSSDSGVVLSSTSGDTAAFCAATGVLGDGGGELAFDSAAGAEIVGRDASVDAGGASAASLSADTSAVSGRAESGSQRRLKVGRRRMGRPNRSVRPWSCCCREATTEMHNVMRHNLFSGGRMSRAALKPPSI